MRSCSPEFMQRIEKLVNAAGGLPPAGTRGALKPLVQGIARQTCHKEKTIYHLLQTLRLERSVILGAENSTPERPIPTVVRECLSAPDPLALANEAVEEGWTTRQTRQEATRRRNGHTPPQPRFVENPLSLALKNLSDQIPLNPAASVVAAMTRQWEGGWGQDQGLLDELIETRNWLDELIRGIQPLVISCAVNQST
jgi:hypothetical protein